MDDHRFFVVLRRYNDAADANARSHALCDMARLALYGPRDEARAAKRWMIEKRDIRLGMVDGEAVCTFMDRRAR